MTPAETDWIVVLFSGAGLGPLTACVVGCLFVAGYALFQRLTKKDP